MRRIFLREELAMCLRLVFPAEILEEDRNGKG